MNPDQVIDVAREAIKTCLIIGGPILLVSLIVGIVIGVCQAMCQVHDQTVSFVPKLIGLILVLALALPWLTDRMIEYSRETFSTPILFNSNPTTFRTASVAVLHRDDQDPAANTSPMQLPKSQESLEPSKIPFQLPNYRFSRLQKENKEL